jgi:preprotein translocase subunit SecG
MSALDIIIGILVLLISIIVVAVVLLQQGHRSGINGAISGAADTFLSKTKARTADAKLARITKFIALGFFVLVLLANIIGAF